MSYVPVVTDTDFDLSRDAFLLLEKHWQGYANGVDRLGYTQNETEAHEIVSGIAHKLGAQIVIDDSGSSYAVFSPKNEAHKLKPAILSGSHLDAVPKGGRYDGPAGVIAPLQAIANLLKQNIDLPQPVVIPMWRAEESPATKLYAFGSRAAMATLPSGALSNPHGSGHGLVQQHMIEQGANMGSLTARLNGKQASLPLDNIAGLVEVHIEQETSLLDAGNNVGLVTSVRGNFRPPAFKFIGEAAHTGAQPQHKRKNAALAAAKFVSSFDEALRKYISEYKNQHNKEPDLVYAPTDINVPNPSATTVAAEATVTLDVRSTDNAVLADVERIILDCAEQAAVATHTKLEFDRNRIVRQEPEHLSGDLRAHFRRAANECAVPHMDMPSGAGHDAAITSAAGIPSAMLFLRHRGESHNPIEIMTDKDDEDPFKTGTSYSDIVKMLMWAFANGLPENMQRTIPLRPTNEDFVEAMKARGGREWRAAS